MKRQGIDDMDCKQHDARTSAAISIATALGALVLTGCLQLNEDHCAANGGDIDCGDATPMCTMSISEPIETSKTGCVAAGANGTVPDGFVHIKYGLPRTFGEPSDTSLDTVIGVLAKVEPDCTQSGDRFDDIRDAYSKIPRMFFDELDGRTRVEKDAITTPKSEVDGFNEEIDAWRVYCPGSTTATSTGPETDSDHVTETSESSTTGPMTPCTVATQDEDCLDPERPFCAPGSGICVACDGTTVPDATCAMEDPMRPVCVDGRCVACTPENPLVCEQQLLLCDDATNGCVSCTEHEQCVSGACELAVGRCFEPGAIFHVDADGGEDYTSIAAAVGDIGAGMQWVVIVHQIDDGSEYAGVTIDGAKRIALRAAPNEMPRVRGVGGNPSLSVEGAATILYVDRLWIVDNALSVGLQVDTAFAWVDRSQIVSNRAGGILAQDGAELVLRSSFVAGNGDGFADQHGIEVFNATASILYTTVARNNDEVTDSIRCAAATVDVRNSIVVGREADSIDCPGIVITDSALDEDIGDNTSVGPTINGWFADVTMGDYHLSNSGAAVFADIAIWRSNDPLTDIDGDDRPQVDGDPDYAGADVPSP